MTIYSGSGPRPGAKLRVLITGAGGGVGYACARAFAERGAELILSDIDGQALNLASSNLSAIGRFCDVASEASVAVFAAGVLKSHASIDVLINAAGKSYVRNLGTMRITRAFLPMMKSDGGKKDIVNIAPMGSTPRGSCHFPYAASQEAFDRLSEAFAENIRGTRVALTTIVPNAQPIRPEHAAAPSLQIVDPSNLDGFDPDRVAAAVVEAVHSKATRPGKTTLLTAQTISHDPGRLSAAPAYPRARKLG